MARQMEHRAQRQQSAAGVAAKSAPAAGLTPEPALHPRELAQRQRIQAAFGTHAGAHAGVVQRRAPPALREMKRSYDAILRRIPDGADNRLDVAGDAAALAADVQTWRTTRQAADQLWQDWAVAYTRAENNEAVAYPSNNWVGAQTQMEQHAQTFAGVAEHIIDNGLTASKLAVMEEHYVQPGQKLGNTLTNAWLNQAPNENRAAFKGRARALVLAYIRPGQDAWFTGAGYAGNPIVVGQGQLGTYAAHWTLYPANTVNVPALRCDAPNATQADALVPSGAGNIGVHVSLEVPDVGDNKPRVFGRPANAGRQYNGGYLPGTVTWATMRNTLDNANAAQVLTINNWAAARVAQVQAGWENH